MNIYQLNDHLSAVQTQNMLAIAVLLGVIGFLLAEQSLLWRLYALIKRLLRTQAPAPVGYASSRK